MPHQSPKLWTSVKLAVHIADMPKIVKLRSILLYGDANKLIT